MSKLTSLTAPIFTSIFSFDHNMTGYGWQLEKDAEITAGKFTPNLVDFLELGELFLSSDDLSARATARFVAADQHHLEAMLREPRRISKEWRAFRLLGISTVWIDAGYSRSVPFLQWSLNQWYLKFTPFIGQFNSTYQMLKINRY